MIHEKIFYKDYLNEIVKYSRSVFYLKQSAKLVELDEDEQYNYDHLLESLESKLETFKQKESDRWEKIQALLKAESEEAPELVPQLVPQLVPESEVQE